MKIHTKLKEVSIIVPTESWHLVIYIYIFMKVKCLHHKLLSPWQNCFCGKRLLASGNKKTNKCCWVLWKSLCADSWLTFTQKCYGNFAMRTWHWMNLGWILNNEIVKVLHVSLLHVVQFRCPIWLPNDREKMNPSYVWKHVRLQSGLAEDLLGL